MSNSQVLLFTILAGAMAFFVWGRYRYDIVAFGALVVATLLGIVPAAEAFLGFGHPAVITVAAVLVISRALQNSGVVDLIAARLEVATRDPLVHIGALTGLAALLSGFMNNVGALALLMPVALQTAAATGRSPAQLLMPLSFGSILGGLMTLMGTPPNIIIASYRQELTGASFGIFDFSPVGVVLALGGVVFITLVGWRLIPKERRGKKATEDLFEITDYITELRVLEDSPVIGKGLKHLEVLADDEVLGVGILRGDNHMIAGARYARLRPGDIVILEADPTALAKVVAAAKLELVGKEAFDTDDLTSEEAGLIEAVVSPGSRLVKRTFAGLRLGKRFNMNLIAIARQGKPFKRRLDKVRLQEGDVLLLQGERDSLAETVVDLGCLPLAERGLRIRSGPKPFVPVGIFAAALIAAVSGLLPVYVAFSAAIVLLVLMQVVSLREVYSEHRLAGDHSARRHDSPGAGAGDHRWHRPHRQHDCGHGRRSGAVVYHGSVAGGDHDPVGRHEQCRHRGGDGADRRHPGQSARGGFGSVSDGGRDRCLVCVVMGPGGYKFSDYWRMGLPLELLIVAVAIPLIVVVWPL